MHLSSHLLVRRAGLGVTPAQPDTLSELVELLRPYANEVDGPPAIYHELMAAAFAFRDPDGALAELLDDSTVAAWHAGVRSASTVVDTLLFDLGNGQRLDVEIIGRHLVADLFGGVLTGAAWQTPTERHVAEVAFGESFEIEVIPDGPFCLIVEVDGVRTTTDWLLA
jgi:hypothetical protein